MSKYSDSDLMGHRCELTWFKDIRRYAQYQSLNQQRRGRPVFRRGYQYNNNSSRGRDPPRRRYSDRDDDRSRSRSRDRGRSSSYSRSPSGKSGDSSRSRSRSSERAASEDRNRRSSSRDSNSAQGREKDRDGDPDRKHRKKDKKHKKSKKKRSGSGSRSSSEDRSSTPEQAIFGRHAPAGSPVSPNQEDSPTASAPAAADPPPKADSEQSNADLAPPPLPPPIISASPVRFPIRIQTPANVIGSTTFAIGIDSDEPPRKVLRRMSPPAGSAVTPPSVAAQEEEKLAHEAQETVMAAIDLPPPPCPPQFSSEKRANSSLCKPEQQDKKPATPPSELPSAPTPVQQSTISSLSETPSKLASSRFPTTTRLFNQLKDIQSTIIKTVKVEPKSNEASGGLRLSSLATCQQDTDEEKRTIRESRLSKLDEISLERFMVRKKKLEETFRGDCQTYAFVTKKLIEKDPSLESQLRIALIENMEDLEKQVYEQVDVYLDTICD